MNPNELETRKELLAVVLYNHFNSMSEPDRMHAAQELLSGLSVGSSLQALERTDRPPEADRENLRKAANALGRAINHLEKVGYHGSKHVTEFLQGMFTNIEQNRNLESGLSLNVKDFLIQHIGQIEQELSDAADQVDPSGMSLNTAFGEGPAFERFSGQAKGRETAARFFAQELAILFHAQTDQKPSVSTNSHDTGNPAYGPFLNFVRDAFCAVGLSASPETWARQASKDFSPDN